MYPNSQTASTPDAPALAAEAMLRGQPRSIAVLHGGRSGERAISLASGAAVLGALRASGGGERLLDVQLELDGTWSIDGERAELPAALERLREVEVCFLALHGGDGEGGGVQGLLTAAGLPFTGSGVAASALALDKWLCRVFLAAAGVRMAPGLLVPVAWDQGAEASAAAGAERVCAQLPSASGWFVKPRRGGSSLATTRVERRGSRAEDLAALGAAIEAVLRLGEDGLVEARVQGVEVTTAVLGNSPGPLAALPVVEIAPRGEAFFDYEQKYGADGAQERCPAPSLDPAGHQTLERLAMDVHRAVGCAGFSRSDWILRRAPGGSIEPVFLEINTLPGLTERSLVPLAAKQAGLDLATLARSLCALALEPHPVLTP
jgi:D-alanine-D-alanine ligase